MPAAELSLPLLESAVAAERLGKRVRSWRLHDLRSDHLPPSTRFRSAAVAFHLVRLASVECRALPFGLRRLSGGDVLAHAMIAAERPGKLVRSWP